MTKNYSRALTIAGSDSGGGAGIQADLKAFSALGCYGMSVLTALTAQNTVAVTAIEGVPVDFIAAQIDAVLDDIGTDAVKIGMLHSPEVIATVAERLTAHQAQNIVLDPVMVAKSGDKLLRDDAIDALVNKLFPIALMVTPNVPEAEAILNRALTNESDLEDACRDLAKFGPKWVLLKGGHLEGAESSDVLYDAGNDVFYRYHGVRIETPNTHGTGCSLSSAIASGLAKGQAPADAVQNAKHFIASAIAAGADYKIGEGHGPVHHFHQWW
ncbi:MAG: bifunctional hydroxymethylpyrimidine kinase/phosphomethylpyrimidine kinase [Pontibacterium sp.]